MTRVNPCCQDLIYTTDIHKAMWYIYGLDNTRGVVKTVYIPQTYIALTISAQMNDNTHKQFSSTRLKRFSLKTRETLVSKIRSHRSFFIIYFLWDNIFLEVT